YSTRAHGAALARLGPSSQHRYSFINVRRLVSVGEPGEHGDLECGKMDSDLHEGQLSR
ncbi:MAG: ribonuclease HII, partial [Rhodococcus sp. (in: high G+C Gram-positive bacteria)]